MHRNRNALLFLPLVPAAALVATPWLPFVNSARLWAGLPPMLVWTSLWVLALVPALAAVEWGWRPSRVPSMRSGAGREDREGGDVA